MTIDVSTIITIGSVLVALVTIYQTAGKIHTWVERQNEQDVRCKQVQEEQNKKIETIQEEMREEIRRIQEEQCLLVYAVLACLKGLKQQGCNGDVTVAIQDIEKHINKQAHDI
jgi:hypothetical protein